MGFKDNWKYLGIGSICCIGIILLAVIFGFGSSDVNTTESVQEKNIHGANDFTIPAPYSEDNFKFKENNNENTFIAHDSSELDSNMLMIEKLNSSEFKQVKNSYDFTDRNNSVDSFNYVCHKHTKVNSAISYLYSSVDEHCLCGERSGQWYYVEIVEVNNNKYKISIGNTCVDFDNVGFSPKDWEDYLIKFNKVNKVKVLEVK